MTEERGPRLERLLEQTARFLSGGGLHPVEILQRVESAVLAAARDGVAPNAIRVAFHPQDFERYTPAFGDLRAEIDALLDRLESRESLRRIGDRLVEFEVATGATPGLADVTAAFADTANRTTLPPAGATQVIHRLRGATLVFGDGSKVRLTHTPFRIGRGPGNDLVYPNLTLSREHAEIVSGSRGALSIRDRGSRNGLIVDGNRVPETELLPGRRVWLGDVELWLEEAR